MAAHPEIVEYIRQSAIARGIDPEIALRVAESEALNVFDPSKPDMGGDDHSSFGPFQFHYGGRSQKMPNAGMGDDFTAATGLRADDPSTWRQQVDFALDQAKKGGWGPWMGAARVGITGMQGINGGGGGGGGTSPSYAPTAVAGRDPAGPAQAMADALAARADTLADLETETQPKSLLADTLASSVKPKSSGTGGITPDATDQETAIPAFSPEDFAPTAVPETPRPEVPVQQAAQPTPLADLFKVRDIGITEEIDPYTGRPRPYRSRRAYG